MGLDVASKTGGKSSMAIRVSKIHSFLLPVFGRLASLGVGSLMEETGVLGEELFEVDANEQLEKLIRIGELRSFGSMEGSTVVASSTMAFGEAFSVIGFVGILFTPEDSPLRV